MKKTGFLLLLALPAAAGVAWCETEADFARADRLPLPPSNWDNGGTVHIYVGPEVSAQFLNEVGFSYYGVGDYGMALAVFTQAVKAYSGHLKAMYNAACSAVLLGEVASSLGYLTMLKAQGSATAPEYLAKVDSDSDFDSIRSRSEFTRGLRSIRSSGR